MRLEKVLFAQAIRFLDFTDKNRKLIPPARITRAIQLRYEFAQVPNTVENYNFQRGVTFLGGYFQEHPIDRFQIYERGWVCETQESTDFCDAFLDDLALFTEKELERPSVEVSPPRRVYTSNIEVHSDVNIASALPMFSQVGQMIWEALGKYGQKAMFELSGIKLHTDTLQLAGAKPLEFVFERRSEKPYFGNIYFAAAPLRTQDHLEILSKLETVLISSTASAQPVSQSPSAAPVSS